MSISDPTPVPGTPALPGPSVIGPLVQEELRKLGESFRVTREPAGDIPAGQEVTVRLNRSLDDLSLAVAGVATPIPVSARVKWTLHADDARRTALRLGDKGDAILKGDTGPTPTVLLKPAIVERVAGGRVPATSRIVRATVTLTARLSSVGLEDVSQTFAPELRLPQLALPVPRLLILHRNRRFEPRSDALVPAVGAALVVIPGKAPLSITAPNGDRRLWGTDAFNGLEADLLAPLLGTVGKLTQFTGFLAAHGQLGDLLDKLKDVSTFVRIHRADRIDNLNDERFFTLIDRGVPVDGEVDNEMSSLALLGVPGSDASRVRLYENRNCDSGDGRLLVSPGDFGVTVVGDLHRDRPVSEPPGKAVARPVPAGLKTFGDQISSLEFG
jgi:hypothetical protein